MILGFIFSGYAASVDPSPATAKTIPASQVIIPISPSASVSLADFVTLTPGKFRELTGKKLSLIGKLSLKITQKKFRRDINKDGTIDHDKLGKYKDDGRFRLHGGGFALGLFLLWFGVMISVFFNDRHRKSRIISALIGWGAWIVIVLLLA
jgi:hypothetical protein